MASPLTRRLAAGSPEPKQQPSYQLYPVWQAALVNSTQVSVIISLISNGLPADHFDHHHTLTTALSMLSAFIFLAVFTRNIENAVSYAHTISLRWLLMSRCVTPTKGVSWSVVETKGC
jgi:hypothetical protein